MLGSARVSRAGDRVLAIANVLAVKQNEQRCGFYGSGRVASRPNSLLFPFIMAKLWKSVSARTGKPARQPRARS